MKTRRREQQISSETIQQRTPSHPAHPVSQVVREDGTRQPGTEHPGEREHPRPGKVSSRGKPDVLGDRKTERHADPQRQVPPLLDELRDALRYCSLILHPDFQCIRLLPSPRACPILRPMRFPRPKMADIISMIFLVGLSLLVLGYWHRLPEGHALLVRYGILLALQVGVILGRDRWLPAVLTAFFPLVPLLAVYDSLGFIPALNPADKDRLLLEIDRALLGADLSLRLESFTTPWLTELMQLSYLVYYVVPFLLLGTLYLRFPVASEDPGKTGPAGEAFDLCIVALLLSHYLAFIGYMTVPALGPRFALASSYRMELTGLLLASPITELLNALEGIKRDAFPSGHTSAALICLYYTSRFTPRWLPFVLPGVVLMVLAAMYLRYHYLADVLAGALLAALCLALAPWLLRYQTRSSGSHP